MVDAARAVWVTRPAAGAESTARALGDAGYIVVTAPVLEIVSIPPDPIPKAPWPDWVVFVSANAVEGLTRAMAAPAFPTLDDRGQHPVRCAAVGRRTAVRAAAVGWHVLLTPTLESASGLIDAFRNHDIKDRRIWIPTGSRAGSAKRDLPAALRAAGACVEVFQVYETRDRPLEAQDFARLDAATPSALIVHSPSAAEAIYGAGSPAALARWRAEAVAVAIGPSTRKRLEKLGAFRIHECADPTDGGILEVLASIEPMRPQE